MGARREVVSAVTERYRLAKQTEKGRILDELCATTGWHRKHSVRALRRRLREGCKVEIIPVQSEAASRIWRIRGGAS